MKNKKLMLIATAAMGFVALGAAGVGTMAWFKVTDANTSVVPDTKDITVMDNPYSVGTVTFTATLAQPAAKNVSLSDSDGKVWYYAGSTKTEDTSKAIGDTYQTVTLTNVTASVSTGSLTDALNSLVGKKVVVTISGTTPLKFKSSAAPVKTSGGWANETVTFEENITAGHGATFLASQTFYYGLTGADDNGAQNSLAGEDLTITATVSVENV